ncbi:uncharacterized protein SPSK_02875 [Sporothrix schenckii 1099-18]|uniref:Uncharacterized protein n=1 Tax=Sporothrix schenckii 1099-18 TaxID=1397361 RepID=A0A0F2ME86_SPOSC|nr:uncharacterized protein SPSK_02875 [Sporothrix schenckii 1099-18]KJR86456.1 hypothetical protein SPSK_02875 [Sporothrix schenckii 1099-18]
MGSGGKVTLRATSRSRPTALWCSWGKIKRLWLSRGIVAPWLDACRAEIASKDLAQAPAPAPSLDRLGKSSDASPLLGSAVL